MIRIDYRYQIWLFIAFVIIQIPLLYKYVLFDKAFGFFYVGFLLFFPTRASSVLKLSLGFIIGLLIDVFSNTPGMHASVSVVIMFFRDYWIKFVMDDSDEVANVSVLTLGLPGTLIYLLPLIFIHHILLFSIEYGRLEGYWMVVNRSIWSTLLTFTTIYFVNYLIAPKARRT